MINTQSRYKGIIVPAVTPLTTSLALDEQAVERLFEMFYTHGISPFILGTTGESASLSAGVKKGYIKKAGAVKSPGTMLYAGISSNIVDESIELADFAAQHGIDAVAATLPSYFQLTESQMQKYFQSLADRIAIPLILYNIPATTHMSIPVQLIDELSHHPNIIAVKDSERSEERLDDSLNRWKERSDFSYFLGWAARSAKALLNGSAGLIPSTGNIAPEIYSAMWTAANKGDSDLAYQMQEESDRIGNLYQSGCTLGESIFALKEMMSVKGICQPVVMPPL